MFKKIKHKSFSYKPRYYDPAKEELDQRMAPYRNTDKNDPELAKARIRQGFQGKLPKDRSVVKKLNFSSNLRLVLIIGILLMMVYMLLTSDSIQKILETF